jgi:hypothetical protein
MKGMPERYRCKDHADQGLWDLSTHASGAVLMLVDMGPSRGLEWHYSDAVTGDASGLVRYQVELSIDQGKSFSRT